jgi:hypothetical protein
VADWPRESWLDAEPTRAEREREEMTRVAPEMVWLDVPAGGWVGCAPRWPFPRGEPAGLETLLEGQQLRLAVQYSEGFPMVEPKLYPLEPDPPRERRILHSWHLMGDGGLCLLQTADLWTGRDSAADLVVKASGWFIEYRLMERGLIERMTESGIYSDATLDPLIEELAR